MVIVSARTEEERQKDVVGKSETQKGGALSSRSSLGVAAIVTVLAQK